MRFTKLVIDGYGRFTGKDVELVPGLQILAGPNEQGKTTLRHFVCDMLYGQKSNGFQQSYDEMNEIRAPWKNDSAYGGRVEYTLDSGEVIEFTNDEIERLQHEIAEQYGYEIIDHNLVLYVKRKSGE